jgi:cleavage stimulation factor subunit 3
MAAYDPTSPSLEATGETLDPAYAVDHEESGEEDDDYDPSAFTFEDSAGATPIQESALPDATTVQPESPKDEQKQVSKPRTIGGFIVEESDDEEESDAIAAPAQADGASDGQPDPAAEPAVQAQDISLHSKPQEDASAVPSPQIAQSTSLNGSAHISSVPQNTASLSPSASLQVDSPAASKPVTPAAPGVQNAPPIMQPDTTNATAPPVQTNGSSQPNPAQQRLPHDKVGQLEDRIKDDPKADTDAWRSLIAHYREKGQLDKMRTVYSRFLEVFPSAVRPFPYAP